MKGGRIVRMRLAPADCMSVLDGVKKLGLSMSVLSFDAAARVVFSSLIEGARQGGVLPTRTGFEFNELMAQYMPAQPVSAKRKLEATQLIDRALYEPVRTLKDTATEIPVTVLAQEDIARASRLRQYTEMKFKRDYDLENFTLDLKNTPGYQEDWYKLAMEFYDAAASK